MYFSGINNKDIREFKEIFHFSVGKKIKKMKEVKKLLIVCNFQHSQD